jgi:hypothetical protein
MPQSTPSWKRVSASNVCPVCKKSDKCTVSPSHDDPEVVQCLRQSDFNGIPAFKTKDTLIGTAHFHRLKDRPGFQENRPIRPTRRKKESPILSPGTHSGNAPEHFAQSEALSISPEDADLRHRVYTRLIERCTLTEEHRRDNAARGLDLKELGYGSLPGATGRIVSELLAEFPDLVKVPGFVEKEPGKIVINSGAGLLVPSRNRLREIVRLERRHPSPKPRAGKWVPLSGGEHHNGTAGASAGTPLHWARVPDDSGVVIVTEGARKADTIAAKIPGVGVVSVPGVGLWKATGLVEELDAVGCKVVRIAYDADVKDNPHVARAALQLATALEESGLLVEFAVWEGAKGMDDALLMAGLQIRYLKGDEDAAHRETLAKLHGLNPDGTKPDDPRPEIVVNSGFQYALELAAGVIAESECFYMRHGVMVCPVVTDEIANEATGETTQEHRLAAATKHQVAAHLVRHAKLRKIVDRGNGPVAVESNAPDWLTGQILDTVAIDGYKRPRSICGILEGPTLDKAGNLINSKGYHSINGHGWFMGSPINGLNVPGNPTLDDCRAAEAKIWERVKHFPWRIDSRGERFEYSKWLTFLLAATIRPQIPTTPTLLITANVMGSGKTYLAQALNLIVSGSVPALKTCPKDPRNREEELGKLLATAIQMGHTFLCIDNLPNGEELSSESICTGATGEKVERRMMQRTDQMAGGTNRLMLVVTGNNVQPSSDTADRVLKCSLESSNPNPRSIDVGEKYGVRDLIALLKEHDVRREILECALTIIRGFISAGRPAQPGRYWGSFPEFTTSAVFPVRWVLGIDPMADRLNILEEDPKHQALLGVASGWLAKYPLGFWVTASDLFNHFAAGALDGTPEQQDFMDHVSTLWGHIRTSKGFAGMINGSIGIGRRFVLGNKKLFLDQRLNHHTKAKQYCIREDIPKTETYQSETISENSIALNQDLAVFAVIAESITKPYAQNLENEFLSNKPKIPLAPRAEIPQLPRIPHGSNQSDTIFADRLKTLAAKLRLMIPPKGIPRCELRQRWLDNGETEGDYEHAEFLAAHAKKRDGEMWLTPKA